MMNGPSWQIAQVGSSVKNTFSFRSICPPASITGNPYHHHPYQHELSSLLVFTIIIVFKQNSTVQFLPIKTSWQSFHRLPWNFSHDLDSRARRLERGKAPFQILPVKGEPQCLPHAPPSNATFRSEASNDLRIPFTFICGACAETSPTFSGALMVEVI